MSNNTLLPQNEPRPNAFPTFRRIFSWRVLRGILFVFLCLVTLLALVWAEESWRGARAWDKCRRALEAKGEKLDLAAFIPPPVPPEQNFTATPLLTNTVARIEGTNPVSIFLNGTKNTPSLGNWQIALPADLSGWQAYFRKGTNYPVRSQPQSPAADVLLALGKYDAELKELKAASQRPYAQFVVPWERSYMAPLTHLSVLKSIAQTARLRALAELDAGQPDRALDDLKLCFCLADTLKGEPELIAYLVRMAVLQSALQPIWEGLDQGRWTEAHLASLQKELAAVDFMTDQIRVVRGERAFANQCIALLISGHFKITQLLDSSDPDPYLSRRVVLFTPRGLLRQNQVKINLMAQDMIDTMQAAVGARGVYRPIDLSRFAEWEQRLARTTPYNILAKTLIPAYAKVVHRTQQAQTGIDLALVACALERYRLARGEYPARLEALAPAYLERVPQDVVTGGPLNYRKTPGGRFVLYSVGENRVDDGGEVHLNKNKTGADRGAGDWVWRYRGD